MSQEEFDSSQQWIEEWRVPLSCPYCTGRLSLVGYVSSKSPKSQYCHACSHCNFVRSVDDFKRDLLTV